MLDASAERGRLVEKPAVLSASKWMVRLQLALHAARRALMFAVLLLLVNFLVFTLLDVLPGNAASQVLGFNGTTEQVAALAHQWGLDAPLLERFASWICGVFSGDLGKVLSTGKPVVEAMSGPLSRTAVMFVVALVATSIFGVALGAVSGLTSGRTADRVISASALVFTSLPEFIIAIVVVFIFATELNILPAVSLMPVNGNAFATPAIFVLPALTMSLIGTVSMIRRVRAVVQKESQTLHVEAARLAGVSTMRVVIRHVMPACAAPIAQAIGQVVPYLVGGTAIVESVFSFPGLGSMLVTSVQNREPNVLMACALVMTAVTLVAFWAADLLRKRP